MLSSITQRIIQLVLKGKAKKLTDKVKKEPDVQKAIQNMRDDMDKLDQLIKKYNWTAE